MHERRPLLRGGQPSPNQTSLATMTALRTPPPSLLKKLYREWTQPACPAGQLHFWHEESPAHLLLTSLPYSPHIMGQEGPCQPHPHHQEEADEDEAWIHSWRGSDRDSEDRGGGEEARSHAMSWRLLGLPTKWGMFSVATPGCMLVPAHCPPGRLLAPASLRLAFEDAPPGEQQSENPGAGGIPRRGEGSQEKEPAKGHEFC